jgi:hypothetical protein
MNLTGVQKLIIDSILKIAFGAALPFAICACGPAITDGEYSISDAPGYFYFDAGGDGKMITRRTDRGKEIVISARVNSHFVQDGKLLASRSPRLIKESDTGNLTSSIDPTCEYWSIDLKTGAAKQEKAPI